MFIQIVMFNLTDPMTPEQVAEGFIKVANEKMCRPIRELSESRGYNPKVLIC